MQGQQRIAHRGVGNTEHGQRSSGGAGAHQLGPDHACSGVLRSEQSSCGVVADGHLQCGLHRRVRGCNKYSCRGLRQKCSHAGGQGLGGKSRVGVTGTEQRNTGDG